MSDKQPDYAVRHLMVNHAGLSALGSRIYALMPPQGTALPYAWFENVQDLPTRHQGAASGLGQALITVHIAAESYAQMATLLTELRLAVNATIAQSITYETGKTIFIHDMTVEREQKMPGGPTDGSDRPVFIGFSDINVWYAQPVA